MLGLSAVVAIAASGAAIIIVFSVVGIVVWVRVRKERHALKLLGLDHGSDGRGLANSAGNTLTTLSNEEGSALTAHGQLPYGKPTEWGQLTSRESLLRKNGSVSSSPFIEKARSLRHSISRSRSKRLSRFSKHSRLSSMATMNEANQRSSPPRLSREDIPLSAVEGVLELPAERTPRQTPEITQEEPGFHLGMRPVSPAWPLPSQRERSGLFPVVEQRGSQDMFDPPPRVFEESPTRLRGSSICSQSAGLAPDEPIPPPPPPPAVFPTERFSYARNDSVMRLSSMSLDTTNSSILDDGRNGPRPADSAFTSPNSASGGTTVPFSASDVGVMNGRRSFITANTGIAMPPLHNFPVRSSSTVEARKRSSTDYKSPRRSMTTASRIPSNSSDRLGGPPHRSESLSSNPPSRHTSLRSGNPIAMSGLQNPNSMNWRSSGSQMACVPHFSQLQQPSLYESEQQNDPFYGGSPQSTGTLFSIESPGQASGSSMPPSPMSRSNLSLRGGSLTSALKSSNSHRKGHRRQNCVRISIHPPMTFGGPNFTPTLEEEPEDTDQMEEVDLRESAVTGKALPVLPVNTPSPLPLSKRTSRRNKVQPSSLGPLAEEPQSQANRSPSKKRKKMSSDESERDASLSKDRGLPELFTSLPPATTEATELSQTPSPERLPPKWEAPEVPSPVYASPGTGSPRRSAVKGPRSQPASAPRTPRRKSTHTPTKQSIDPFVTPGSPADMSQITGTQGSDWRKSTDSLHRTVTNATDRSYRRYRDSRDSLASGLGSSAVELSPACDVKAGAKSSSTVKDRVTIWEDANRGGSPPKVSGSPPKLPAAQLTGSYGFGENNVSPTQNIKNSAPRSLAKPGSPTRQYAPPSPTSARRGMTTPTGKGLGLGIGSATPVSLYDGDGFLRE